MIGAPVWMTGVNLSVTCVDELPVSVSIPPSWHPDPHDPTMLRWWDGNQWTDHRCPPPAVPQPGFQAQVAPTAGYQAYPAIQGVPLANRRTRSTNRFSWTAIGFAAGYLVLAATTNFVLLGIIPVMSSIRAFQRREKLAPFAAIAAVVTVASTVYFLTHHHT
jgi:hypothetical protein